MFKMFAMLIVLSFAVTVEAQVLTTAETLGQGKQALTVSENVQYDAGVDINIAYVMYAKGLTPRFDLYVGVGETHILGQDQAWITAGWNAKLFSVNRYSVSFFTLASIPLHRASESSTVLLNPAVVVSHPISSKLSLYSGVNGLVPVGARNRGLFTPTANKLNVPVGASFTWGSYGVTAEADLGRMKAIGIAVSKVF